MKAAEAMGVSLEEVAALARRGCLEAREFDGDVLIRPAIVRVLGVQERAA
jgi:hypothetical protein